MADCDERNELLDLDVSFNEFEDEVAHVDEDKSNFYPRMGNVRHKEQEKAKGHEKCTDVDNTVLSASTSAVEERYKTENGEESAKAEDGEIMSVCEDDMEEQMDCDQGSVFWVNTLKDVESSAETHTHNNTLLFERFFEQKIGENDTLNERDVKVTECACADRESGMESEGSLDDHSWKRNKRARLEEQLGDDSFKQEQAIDNIRKEKSEARRKTRGGRKKRKRPTHIQQKPLHHQRKDGKPERGIEKLLEPLHVTAQESEEKVAIEIAEKLNETKTLLINRVVTCIGCEKAIKLFKETQEVERHGGIWTKDRSRRRTSGGVFLTLLKHRYIDKEQTKWIFAVENEIAKQKAKAKQRETNELHRRDVLDLRRKLQERKGKNCERVDNPT